MPKCVISFLLLCLLAPAWAGDVSGVVTVAGQDGLRRKSNTNASGVRLREKYKKKDRKAYVRVEPWDEGGLNGKDDERAHVVIFLGDESDGAQLAATARVQEVLQKERRFQKHVTPIVAGSSVRFENDDPWHHYIDCKSDKELNVKEQKPNHPVVKKPTTTGPLELFCNIHHRMNAYIYVVPNDFFTVPVDGKFTLKNVPPGKYVLKAWHPRAANQPKTQPIEVPRTGSVEVNFNL